MTHEDMKVGQVVMLASGGPKMTVASINAVKEERVKEVNCEWFCKRLDDFCDGPKNGWFYPEQLFEIKVAVR